MNKIIDELTILKVKEEPIYNILINYIPDLKKQGQNYVCKSPFNPGEKTPSFNVIPKKNFFYCFSTDKGGDAIQFVREYKQMTFPEAVIDICEKTQIEVVFENRSEAEIQEMERKRKQRKKVSEALEWATAWFQSQELPEAYLKKRHIHEAAIKSFRIGYAPDSWKKLHDAAKKKGFTDDILIRAGLIREFNGENGKFYGDYFRDRVMLPIMDGSGNTQAFTSRAISDENKPKYLNSPDSAFNKSEALYGLHEAAKQMLLQKNEPFKKQMILVEGPFDVIQLWQKGIRTVVAPMGIGFTEHHSKLIKRYSYDLLIIPDADTAGMNARHKIAETAIKSGLDANMLVIPTEHNCKDADDYARYLGTADAVKDWIDSYQHYITSTCLNEIKQLHGTKEQTVRNLTEINDKKRRLFALLEHTKDQTTRDTYIDILTNELPDFKKQFVRESSNASNLNVHRLQKSQKDQYDAFGFWTDETKKKIGYYGYNKDGKEYRASNFILKVLFFMRDSDDPSYLIELKNRVYSQLTVLKTDDLNSRDAFQKIARRKGHFLWFADNTYLYRMQNALFEAVPEAKQFRYIGYHPNLDYYVWANGIYFQNQFFQTDEYNMVHIPHRIETYEQFKKLPIFSRIKLNEEEIFIHSWPELYENLQEKYIQEAIRTGNAYRMHTYYLPYCSNDKLGIIRDDNEGETKYIYSGLEELGIEQFGKLLDKNFAKNARAMLLYTIAACFRDFIFKANNNWFPILNMSGAPGGGKSTAARALNKVFGEGFSDGINLESGSTTVALQRELTAIQNAILWINEYKNHLHPKVIGMLKGLADGSGRVTGVKSQDNSTKNLPNRNAIILSGQEIPTVDSALLERCICLNFTETDRGSLDDYESFKKLQNKGAFNCLVHQLLTYRSFITDYYDEYSRRISREMIELCDKKGITRSDRLVLNMATLIAPYAILKEKAKLNLPYDIEELKSYCLELIVYQQTILASENDIDKFFSVLQSCVGYDLKEDVHYRIKGDKFYLRFSHAFPIYASAANRQSMKALDKSTLRTYLQVNKYFLNAKSVIWFSGINKSVAAMEFDYAKMSDNELDFCNFNQSNNTRDDPEKTEYDAFKLFINGLESDVLYNRQSLIDKFNAIPGVVTALTKAQFNAFASRFNNESTIQIKDVRGGSIILEDFSKADF